MWITPETNHYLYIVLGFSEAYKDLINPSEETKLFLNWIFGSGVSTLILQNLFRKSHVCLRFWGVIWFHMLFLFSIFALYLARLDVYVSEEDLELKLTIIQVSLDMSEISALLSCLWTISVIVLHMQSELHPLIFWLFKKSYCSKTSED